MRLLHFLYTGSLPPLPASAEEANAWGILPGLLFSVYPEVIEEEEEEEEEGEGEGQQELAQQEQQQQEQQPGRLLQRQQPGVESSWSGSTQLLRDLACADRYGLSSLRVLCASLLQLQPAGAAQALELSSLLASGPLPALREAALRSAALDLRSACSSAGMAALRHRSPELCGALLERQLEAHEGAFLSALAAEGSVQLPPLSSLGAGGAAEQEELLGGSSSKGSSSSVVAAAAALAMLLALAAFLSLGGLNTALGPLIPVLNAGAIGLFALAVWMGWLSF
jgi:hypothetical protein